MLVQSVRVAFYTFEPCAISAQWCLLRQQRWLPVPSSVLGSITATRYWLVCQMQTLKSGTCSVLTSTCCHRYACVLSWPYDASPCQAVLAINPRPGLFQDRHDGLQGPADGVAILPCRDAVRSRTLRSSASRQCTLRESRTVLCYGTRAFRQTAAKPWKSLPDDDRLADKLETFRSRLKMHLYRLSYC